jgi:hypothetical protein
VPQPRSLDASPEEKVFEMIHETMVDPKKLDACIEATTEGASYRRMARHLARIEAEIKALSQQKRRMVDLHASEHVAQHVYSDAARAFDKVLDGLNHEKAQLLVGMRGCGASKKTRASTWAHRVRASIDARITEFCNGARARIATCTDFAAKQEFLQNYIEKVIYRRYKVTILGSLSIGSLDAIAATKLTFRVEGEIDRAKVRNQPRKKLPPGSRLSECVD